MPNESYGGSSANQGSPGQSSKERPIGGAATEETGVGSLRNAQSGSISTPGDFGSQGATAEGVFGTSGGKSALHHVRTFRFNYRQHAQVWLAEVTYVQH
jgi:hypothetical protein